MLCAQFGSCHAQGPEPISFPVSLYAPLEIGVRVSAIDSTGTDMRTTGVGSNRAIKDTGPDTITYTWSTNVTGSWKVDLYANYSVVVTQTISWYIQSVDYRGLPMNIGPRGEKFTGQYLWIHFEIQTWTAPRPPTLEEEVQRILQPGSPMMQYEAGNAARYEEALRVARDNWYLNIIQICVTAAVAILLIISRLGR